MALFILLLESAACPPCGGACMRTCCGVRSKCRPTTLPARATARCTHTRSPVTMFHTGAAREDDGAAAAIRLDEHRRQHLSVIGM